MIIHSRNPTTNTGVNNGVTFRRLPNGGMSWSFSTSGEVVCLL